MEKTASVKGFCPFFDEDVTIRASFVGYALLGAPTYATPSKNLCKYRFECGRGTDPDDCPVFNQTFLWNRL